MVADTTHHGDRQRPADLQVGHARPSSWPARSRTYTLHVDSGEYTDNSAITITDVLPNGICPLDDVSNHVTGAPAECNSGAGLRPVAAVPVGDPERRRHLHRGVPADRGGQGRLAPSSPTRAVTAPSTPAARWPASRSRPVTASPTTPAKSAPRPRSRPPASAAPRSVTDADLGHPDHLVRDAEQDRRRPGPRPMTCSSAPPTAPPTRSSQGRSGLLRDHRAVLRRPTRPATRC